MIGPPKAATPEYSLTILFGGLGGGGRDQSPADPVPCHLTAKAQNGTWWVGRDDRDLRRGDTGAGMSSRGGSWDVCGFPIP